MVEKIKTALRISHGNFDTEIQGDIDACLLDLMRAGIPNPNQDDALIYKAVEMYCKWQYDFRGNGDKFEQAYTNLRVGLGRREQAKTDGGELLEKTTRRMVFAEMQSVRQSEFYQADANG